MTQRCTGAKSRSDRTSERERYKRSDGGVKGQTKCQSGSEKEQDGGLDGERKAERRSDVGGARQTKGQTERGQGAVRKFRPKR